MILQVNGKPLLGSLIEGYNFVTLSLPRGLPSTCKIVRRLRQSLKEQFISVRSTHVRVRVKKGCGNSELVTLGQMSYNRMLGLLNIIFLQERNFCLFLFTRLVLFQISTKQVKRDNLLPGTIKRENFVLLKYNFFKV